MDDDKDLQSRSISLISRIRPELNLEKWPIWQTASSVKKETRILKRTFTRPDGVKVTYEVAVGYIDKFGTITTEEQKVYYGLVRIWEERGRPTERVFFSLRELARILGREWGTNVIESLTRSLKRLRITPISWTHSYFNSATKETVEILDDFNILSELKIGRKKKDGVVSEAKGYFRFNDFILNNLLRNYTKPLLFGTVVNFRSEIAQILYVYLDLMLADKYRYERRLEELFDDLGLQGKDYHKPSARKRTLERIILQLIRVQLSTGFIVSITIERTKDGKDYKLIVQKGDTLPEALTETAENSGSMEQPESCAASEMSEEEAQARLNALSDEERQALRDRVAAKVLEEHPILRENSYSNILGRIISRRMQEEMN